MLPTRPTSTRSGQKRQVGLATTCITKAGGVDRLISHNEAALRWGGPDHTDPAGYFAQYGKSWAQFEADVAAYMQTGEVGNGGSVSQGGGTAVSGNGGGSYVSPGTYTVTASALRSALVLVSTTPRRAMAS